MILLAVGIIIGILVSLFMLISELRSSWGLLGHLGEKASDLLPKKRGAIIKRHNISEEWHRDIPTGVEYEDDHKQQ